MDSHLRRAATTLLFLVLTGCSGCAGTAARDNTLLPAMRLAWPPVKAGAERQANRLPTATADLAVIADAERALIASEIPATAMITVDWALVMTRARDDVAHRIAAQEIGAGVGASLSERIRLFEQSINTYLRK